MIPGRIAKTWPWILTAAIMLSSVWQIATSGTIPGFQQDWSWPSSRAFATDWVSGFVGQWSDKGLGQPNLLPLQTYLAVSQWLLIQIVGPSAALVVYLLVVEAVAITGAAMMSRRLQVDGPLHQLIPAILYALGPVFFARAQAGHLAFLLAYALLPWLFVLSLRVLSGAAINIIWLGLTFALSMSQLQFAVYGGVVVVAALAWAGAWRRWPRIAAALGLGLILQLQGIVPLLMSSATSIYQEQRPITAWLLNLSAPPASAAIMRGYFAHYYAAHALAGSDAAAYALLLAGALLALLARRRVFALGAALWLVGFSISAGLRGPLAGAFDWRIAHATFFSAFRDLHYAAALTALGTSVLVGAAIDALPSLAPYFAILTAIIVYPSAAGLGMKDVLVPRLMVNDTNAAAAFIATHGAGRILWLPSEEPVGPAGAQRTGLDIALYGAHGNPSANQDRDIRPLAFAVSSLRIGQPRLDAFRRLGIRYFVVRSYLRSERSADLGTGRPLAFQGLPDEKLAPLLSRTSGVKEIERTSLSRIFELADYRPAMHASTPDPGQLLFSNMFPDATAVLPLGSRVLSLQTSLATADPRQDWTNSFVGAWYTPWVSDSIYPFALTESRRPLSISAGHVVCLAVSSPAGVQIMATRYVRYKGLWRIFSAAPAGGSIAIRPDGLTAVSGLDGYDCRQGNALRERLLVFAARFDPGWRLVVGGSWLRPELADGWAMAWQLPAGNGRLIYLPGIAQGILLIIGGLVLWGMFARLSRTGLV